MSNPRYIGTDLPKPIQWVTDSLPCEPATLEHNGGVLVEVTGELNGEAVTLEGGLTLADKMPFLAHTRVTPYLETVPAVTYIRPVTKAVGVTITVRGIK